MRLRNFVRLSCLLLCTLLFSGCLATPLNLTRDDNIVEEELKARYGIEFDTISVHNLEFADAMLVPHEVHKLLLRPADDNFIRFNAEIKYDSKGKVDHITDNYNEVMFAYSLYPKIRSFEYDIEQKLAERGITAFCEITITRTLFLEGYDVGETLYDFMKACANANAEHYLDFVYASMNISLAVQDDGEDVDVMAAKLEQFIRDFAKDELKGEFLVTYDDVYYQSKRHMEIIRSSHSKLMCNHYLNDVYGSDVDEPEFYDKESEEYQRWATLASVMRDLSDTLVDEWKAKRNSTESD